MNILFTICARAGSKGVKNKNVKLFLGAPLVYYTLSAYCQFIEKHSDEFNVIDLAVNTDSETLIEQCSNAPIKINFIEREQDLGGDKVAKSEVICDTLKKMECRENHIYDVAIDLDLTSPLRTVADIYGCLQALLDNENADVAYSVTNARRLPQFNMVHENENGYFETVIQSQAVTRQEVMLCYDMNASIYAYRRTPLLNTKEHNVLKGNAVAWIMRDTAVLDIDSEEDFELLSLLAEYFFRQYPLYGEIKQYMQTWSV